MVFYALEISRNSASRLVASTQPKLGGGWALLRLSGLSRLSRRALPESGRGRWRNNMPPSYDRQSPSSDVSCSISPAGFDFAVSYAPQQLRTDVVRLALRTHHL